MVKNEEYWIWYSLTSVYAQVDEILVFDNFSQDRTVEIIQGMAHVADKLHLVQGFGGSSEQQNREHMLWEARNRGATHVLFLDGDEVHVEECLSLCRQLLQSHEHDPALQDPPANHQRPLDHEPTDGILIKNIGFKPVHPGFAGIDTCRPLDLAEPDTNHGCYNFAIPISALDGLHGNGLEWGQHGYLEKDEIYIQSSPHTLWLPGLWYYHFNSHPRSSLRDPNSGHWIRPVADQGSVPLPQHVHPPAVLFRSDGPGNPTLDAWGLAVADTVHGVQQAL